MRQQTRGANPNRNVNPQPPVPTNPQKKPGQSVAKKPPFFDNPLETDRKLVSGRPNIIPPSQECFGPAARADYEGLPSELTFEKLQFKSRYPGSEECDGCMGETMLASSEIDILSKGLMGDFGRAASTFTNKITGADFESTTINDDDLEPGSFPSQPVSIFQKKWRNACSRIEGQISADVLYEMDVSPGTEYSLVNLLTTPKFTQRPIKLQGYFSNTTFRSLQPLTRQPISPVEKMARSISDRITLAFHWACGLASLHEAGYVHTSIAPDALGIVTGGGIATPVRGILQRTGVSMAAPRSFVAIARGGNHPLRRVKAEKDQRTEKAGQTPGPVPANAQKPGDANAKNKKKLLPLPEGVQPVGRVFSHLFRGDLYHSAPETFVASSAISVFKDAELIDPYRADEQFYTFTPAADVWSFGICLLELLTMQPVFARLENGITRANVKELFVDLKILPVKYQDELLDLSRTSTEEQFRKEVIVRYVRTSSYLMFGYAGGGSGATAATAQEVQAGDSRRTVILAQLLGEAVLNGLLPVNVRAAWLELLWWMLNPDPLCRPTMNQVCQHPAFQSASGWSSLLLRRVLVNFRPSTEVSVAMRNPNIIARGGWTRVKQQAVYLAITAALVDSRLCDHLPAEAFFVMWDIATRCVAGIDSPEDIKLVRTVAIAAVRLGMLLYDVGPSLSGGGVEERPASLGDPFLVLNETDESRALVPVLVEYLGGYLRRANYLYEYISPTPKRVISVFQLLMGDTPEAVEFQSLYLEVEFDKFVREAYKSDEAVNLFPEGALVTYENLDTVRKVVGYPNNSVFERRTYKINYADAAETIFDLFKHSYVKETAPGNRYTIFHSLAEAERGNRGGGGGGSGAAAVPTLGDKTDLKKRGGGGGGGGGGTEVKIASASASVAAEEGKAASATASSGGGRGVTANTKPAAKSATKPQVRVQSKPRR